MSVTDLPEWDDLWSMYFKTEPACVFGPQTDTTYQGRQPIHFNWLQRVGHLLGVFFPATKKETKLTPLEVVLPPALPCKRSQIVLKNVLFI